MRIAAFLLPAVMSVALMPSVWAGEKHVVTMLGGPSRPPDVFQRYGIRVFLWSKTAIDKAVGTDLEEDIAGSQVLFLPRGSNDIARMVFETEKYREVIRRLLEKGGVVFFDYNTYPAATQLARACRFAQPGPCEKATGLDYAATLTSEGEGAFGTSPNRLSGAISGGYGGWIRVPAQLRVLARMDRDPKAAVMLEQSNVSGKGRVIYSQLAGLMPQKGPQARELFENLWSYLLGANIKASGPGITVGVVDAYKQADPICNPLYLTRAHEIPWWNEQYRKRIPILVAESVGLERRGAPVSVVLDRPVGGFRLVTYYEEEVPCQKKARKDGKTEIIFQTALGPYEHLLLHLYMEGPEEKSRQEGIPSLFVNERAKFLEVANRAIAAKLSTETAGLTSLRLLCGGQGDAVSSWGGVDTGLAMTPSRTGAWKKPEVLERGPVRIVVGQKQSGGAMEVRYTVYAGDNPYIAHSLILHRPQRVTIDNQWSPAGECDNLSTVYESTTGIKTIAMNIPPRTSSRLSEKIGDILPAMKEGWCAFQHRSGEVLGTCFEKEAATGLSVDRVTHQGLVVPVTFQPKRNRINSLVVLTRGDWSEVRKVYIAYRNPPAVLCGKWQDYKPSTPAKPRADRDFTYLIYLRTRWIKPHLGGASPEQGRAKARAVTNSVLKWGANAIRAQLQYGEQTPGRLAYWKELVQLCKRHGVVVFGFCPPPKTRGKAHFRRAGGGRPCPVGDRENYYLAYYGDRAKASSQHGGGDFCHVMDEFCYFHVNAPSQALFKKRYGGALPRVKYEQKLDPKDRHYADSLLFRMEVITELSRDVAKEIRKHLPSCVVSSVVNIKGLNRLDRLSDMEEQSRHLDMPGIDLYASYRNYRPLLMFMRGAFDNKKRVENCVGYDAGEGLRRQLDLSTAYGASIHYFAGSDTLRVAPARMTDIVAPYYCWLKFSGMGRALSEMKPVRYAALLRDRNLLVKTIRNLEAPKDLTTFTLERAVYGLADLNNVQMDMVFSRYFNAQSLKGYRVLLVPDNKYLSEKFGETIRAFLRAGGCVFVEGKSCQANSVMKSLCRRGKQVAIVAGLPLLRRSVNGGCLLYTEGFLSERLPKDARAQSDLKALILKHAGQPPITVRSGGEKDLDCILYSDGGRYLLSVVNNSGFSTHEGKLTLNVKIGRPAVWVDMKTGERADFTGTISCRVQAKGTRFILIAPKASLNWPEARRIEQDGGCYSHSVGMDFMNVRLRQPGTEQRARAPGKIKIAVFVHPRMTKSTPGSLKGQLGVKEALEKETEDIAVTAIQDLGPTTLGSFDVVVIPNVRKAMPPDGWEKSVREYVVAGGNALLVHHAVGFGSAGATFPEVGQGADFVPEVDMQVTSDHPVVSGKDLKDGVPGLRPSARFKSGFPDYISLSAGNAGEVLVKSLRGRTGKPNDVVTAGTVGKGKVVLSGMNLGCQGSKEDGRWTFRAEVTKGGEYEILMNSIRWLAR